MARRGDTKGLISQLSVAGGVRLGRIRATAAKLAVRVGGWPKWCHVVWTLERREKVGGLGLGTGDVMRLTLVRTPSRIRVWASGILIRKRNGFCNAADRPQYPQYRLLGASCWTSPKVLVPLQAVRRAPKSPVGVAVHVPLKSEALHELVSSSSTSTAALQL
jgi:hypothetical protein